MPFAIVSLQTDCPHIDNSFLIHAKMCPMVLLLGCILEKIRARKKIRRKKLTKPRSTTIEKMARLKAEDTTACGNTHTNQNNSETPRKELWTKYHAEVGSMRPSGESYIR